MEEFGFIYWQAKTSFQIIQISSGAHTSSCPVGSGLKWPVHNDSAPPYIFVVGAEAQGL